MFKVRFKHSGFGPAIYDVYEVQYVKSTDKTLFLIFITGRFKWEDSDNFVPVETN